MTKIVFRDPAITFYSRDVERQTRFYTEALGFLAAPHDFLGSLRVAWVQDPEGNPIDIVCRRAKKE